MNPLFSLQNILFLAVATLVVPVMIGGCKTAKDFKQEYTGSINEELNISPLQNGKQLSDIPAPREARFLSENSFYYERPDYRISKLLYLIPNQQSNPHTFYRDNMNRHNWTLMEENRHETHSSLLFKKGKERCIISLEQNNNSQTIVTIKIGLTPL